MRDSASALARSRRVICSCLALCCCGRCFFLSPRIIPACSFYSFKYVQGYKMLARGVTLAGEGAQRPREGLIRWRRGLHCGGMASVLLAMLLRVQAYASLLREWFSVLWCCSDASCHTWSCSRRDVFVLVV
jgi:hypothetical protein